MLSFISQKLVNYLALVIFAIVLLIALAIYPVPLLSDPIADIAGLSFTILTDTAGKPFFLVTTALLCLLPIIFRLPKKTMMKLWVQFAILLVLSFAAKTILKHETAVPRPYTYELERLNLIPSPEDFYKLDQTAKDNVVNKASAYVSNWRILHWEGETNYSFPSGHTIFAAICVLFWGGFLLRTRHYVLAGGLIVWGLGVGISRLWLGMHFPTDVMGSIATAAVLYLLVPEWKTDEEK